MDDLSGHASSPSDDIVGCDESVDDLAGHANSPSDDIIGCDESINGREHNIDDRDDDANARRGDVKARDGAANARRGDTAAFHGRRERTAVRIRSPALPSLMPKFNLLAAHHRELHQRVHRRAAR